MREGHVFRGVMTGSPTSGKGEIFIVGVHNDVSFFIKNESKIHFTKSNRISIDPGKHVMLIHNGFFHISGCSNRQ